MKSFMMMAAIAAGTLLLGLTSPEHEAPLTEPQQIDRIIGEGEFNAFHPITDGDHALQRQQYSDGLLEIVKHFRTRDLSGMSEELRAAREQNLQRLLEYRERGIFPVNFDYPEQILPCFIDRTGAICAAGYLVEKSAGREFAEQINRQYKYATVAQMSSPALERWIASSGLTRAEIATIQRPSIRPPSEARVDAGIADGRFEIDRPARTSIVTATSLTHSDSVEITTDIPRMTEVVAPESAVVEQPAAID